MTEHIEKIIERKGYTVKQIKDAVDIAVGDAGFVSKEVIRLLKIIKQMEETKFEERASKLD